MRVVHFAQVGLGGGNVRGWGRASVMPDPVRRHSGRRVRGPEIGRSGFAAGWGERAGWVVRTGRGLGAERVWCDTLGFPAVVAGVLWPTHTKGYHDVRTQKPYDPGHAARRAGRRDPTRVSAGCPPTGRLLHGFARSPQRAERRGLPPLRPR